MNVLHSYKLTRFSNLVQRPEIQRPFYTLTNLQGSQTCRSKLLSRTSFTLLQTYKVLKPSLSCRLFIAVLHSYKLTRFSNKLLYRKILTQVLHSYKLTRFSNIEFRNDIETDVLHSYKLTRFSNVC